MSVKSEVQVVVCNPFFLLGFSQVIVPMYNKELANRILSKLGELFPNSASPADWNEFLAPGFENLPKSDWLAAIDALLKLGFITGADLREGEGSILVDAANLSLTARGQEELRREARSAGSPGFQSDAKLVFVKPTTGTSVQRAAHGFYLYSVSSASSTLSSSNVFYWVASEELAKTLCQLFSKEYSSEAGEPVFLPKSADEVEQDEQFLLEEALDWLAVYGADPDRGVYDPPPPAGMMIRAEYARRARGWEPIIVARTGCEENSPIEERTNQISYLEATDRSGDKLQMPAEDRRNSGLNLLFLLTQAYYEILECVISTASWCCALDLELNESYLWTITSLKNLLTNHEDLRDFPTKFEPAFPDLYPSTIRDVGWEDMVAPHIEQFLSTVQRYVRSSGIYPPKESSPGWVFVEMFRFSVNTAIERAVAYNERMRKYARSAFFEPSGRAAGATRRKSQGVTKGDMQAQPRGAAAATWDAIEISFLSDERVQIRNGANSETCNYAESGFEDRRSGKPNRAWETLRALAAERGTIRDAAKTGRTWPKVEKRMQEIRKVLRTHFRISADPIPFVEGTGYQARFKVSCRPSFHT